MAASLLCHKYLLNSFLTRSRADDPPSKRKKTGTSALGHAGHSPRATSPTVSLKIHPRSRYGQGTAILRKPMFLGDFSLDEQRHFCHDKRNLHFIPMDWAGAKKVLLARCSLTNSLMCY